ncbi:hypothetical protein pdam_00023747 [Pocillopora damicornis]|uniref:Uncharacterized protein n=1 Tax=Pocillopora damicornis TaxID=46731 RepID=A0A3M6UJS3_POCDA|nr:hypothetical protein pdam_00023747 [Pocillopora damicornis]
MKIHELRPGNKYQIRKTQNYGKATKPNCCASKLDIVKMGAKGELGIHGVNVNASFKVACFFIEDEKGSVGEKGSQGLKGQKGIPGTCDDLFVKLQSLQTYGAYGVKSVNINGHTFLAFPYYFSGSSYNTDSFIYKWGSSKFFLFQSVPVQSITWYPFVINGQTSFFFNL